MQFKGGLLNGSLVTVYGAASYICLLLASNQHNTMKTVCYVLAAIGILIAIYWLATREIMGIPILIVGIVHIGLGARAEHVGMQVGCTGLAVVAFVVGLMMLTMERAPRGESM